MLAFFVTILTFLYVVQLCTSLFQTPTRTKCTDIFHLCLYLYLYQWPPTNTCSLTTVIYDYQSLSVRTRLHIYFLAFHTSIRQFTCRLLYLLNLQTGPRGHVEITQTTYSRFVIISPYYNICTFRASLMRGPNEYLYLV